MQKYIGHVIMYADNMSDAMNNAIKETKRRREIQEAYNEEHGIIPETIKKDVKDVVTNIVTEEKEVEVMNKAQKKQYIEDLEKEMREAAKNLDFERAMMLRDLMFEMSVE